MQKGFANYILVLIVVTVIAAVVVGVMVSKKEVKPIPDDTQKCLPLTVICPDGSTVTNTNSEPFCQAPACPSLKPSATASSSADTASWKTYTDSKLKFSIKYPNNWTVFPNVVGGILPGLDGTIINSAAKLEPHGETLAESGQAGIAIGIAGTDKSPNETLSAFQKRKLDSGLKENDFTDTTLAGLAAIKQIRTGNEPNSSQILYYVSNGSWVYSINTSVRNSDYNQTTDQILASFKFN